MDKKHALLLAFLITILAVGNYLFFKGSSPELEKVIIGRVLDGDTVELEDGRIIRLLNINTPEKGYAFSNEAKNFLEIFKNRSVELESAGIEKYGRTLGRIYSDKYLNLEIVRLGLAHPYIVDESEVEDFEIAQEEAKKNERGIWKKSEFYGCLEVEINKNDEYVEIMDSCGLEFKGWTLKDESTKSYKMDKIKTREFRIYSEKGDNKGDEFYWGRGTAWNDDKDAIFIRDSKGLLAYYYRYGY